MMLTVLSNELLLDISEQLKSEKDINAFAQTNHRLYELLNDSLYRHNIRYNESSALKWAAETGQIKTCQRLLDLGAVVGGLDQDVTPLQLAVRCGHEGILKLLIARAVDCNDHVGHLRIAMCDAVEHQQAGALDVLLEQSVLHDSLRENTLRRAAWEGYEEIVRVLTKHGADPTCPQDFTALNAAAWQGFEGIVRILLEASSPSKELYFGALYAASEGGRLGLVKLLLDMGADANAQRAGSFGWPGLDTGQTYAFNALGTASYRGHEEVVRTLVEAGAEIDASYAQYDSALRMAAIGDHERIVEYLLEKGADVRLGGLDDDTLRRASSLSREEIIQLLLDAGEGQLLGLVPLMQHIRWS
jgi:ankyrin repeat protein